MNCSQHRDIIPISSRTSKWFGPPGGKPRFVGQDACEEDDDGYDDYDEEDDDYYEEDEEDDDDWDWDDVDDAG